MLRAKDAEERESKERDEARERADALAESVNGRSTRLGSEEAGSSSSKKRRLETSDGNGSSNGDSSRRLTRSSAAQTSSGSDQQPRQPSRLGEDVNGAISVDDDDDNDDDADWNLDTERRSPTKASNGAAAKANGSRSSSSKGKNKELKDISATDVFPCPMCTFSGTLQALNRHLDTPGACPTSDDPSKKNGNGAGGKGMSGWFSKGSSSNSGGPSAPLVKLKRPQYQLLSEKALRKLCEESGLTTTGHRSLLEARHRRWIDLFNSDLDASPAYRRGVGKLKKEMREWEKGREREEAEKARSKGVSTSTSSSSSSTTSSSMGGHHASSAAPNVGASEEERRAYAHAQRDHFKEIVEQARMSHQKNKVVHREELPTEDIGGGGGSGSDGHGAEERAEVEGAQEKVEGAEARDGHAESNVKTDVASAGAAEEGEEAMVGQQHEAAGGVQTEYQTLPAATNAPAPAP